MRVRSTAAALAAFATCSLARHFSQQCFSDICYTLNIPQRTASSGNGNIYFQISAPTSYSWIALGQGTGMVGANIFGELPSTPAVLPGKHRLHKSTEMIELTDVPLYSVIYTDGHGNVTLSPRQGLGHFEPEHDTRANVTLLEGSGIKGGKMIANVLCSNCHRWQGGSTDFTSSTGDWIHASRPGDPLDSTNVNENIEQHDDHGPFTWTYTSAKGGDDVNPFVKSAHTNGVSSPPPASGGSNNGSSGDDDDVASGTMIITMFTAHGTLASIVFLVLFPIGAIVVRVLNLPVWVHAGIQLFTYCCFIAAAGLGIYLAHTLDLLMNHHPIIGMILLALLFIQPFFGLLHHSSYKKLQRRTLMSYLHIWEGRVAIILGMINGGFGIQLGGNVKTKYIIAYGVVAGVMGLVYLATVVFGEVRRRKDRPAPEHNERK